jgi:8-oxo-dGTP diphosphatase
MRTFRPTHAVRVGAIVLNERGELLVVQHARRGERYWTVPGGSVEITESLDVALSREVREETGCVVDVRDICCVAELRYDIWSESRLEIFFHCVVLERVEPEQRGERIVAVEWRSAESLGGTFRPTALLSHVQRAAGAPFLANVRELGLETC